MGGGRLGRSLPVPSLSVAASWGSVTVHPFTTSRWGPSSGLGGVCFTFFGGVFPFPTPTLALPLFPAPGLRTASNPPPLPCHLQRRRQRPQKVKCPLLDRAGFVLWIPGWVEEGCAHSEPAGLPLLSTSVLLITPFRCLRFLVQAHLKGLLKCGGGRLEGEEASKPPAPSQGSELP